MIREPETEMLGDDCFEGSSEVHKIFREVFFGSETGITTKRCLVTGVINFECDSIKNGNSSLSYACEEGSKDGSDLNTKAKRAKLSSSGKGSPLSCIPNSDFAREAIPLHLVESSNKGVSTRSYLLKQGIEKGKDVYMGGIVS